MSGVATALQCRYNAAPSRLVTSLAVPPSFRVHSVHYAVYNHSNLSTSRCLKKKKLYSANFVVITSNRMGSGLIENRVSGIFAKLAKTLSLLRRSEKVRFFIPIYLDLVDLW